MSWMLKLYETYENCKKIAGDIPSGSDVSMPLLPVAHTTIQAHVEITIDEEGNFKRADVVDKDRAVTIIPCTEKSSIRTSGVAPHPLCDKLQYVAADYSKFDKKKKSHYEKYIKLLEDWCSSEFSHWKAEAVLKYVKKGTVIQDLIDSKVFITDSSGKLIDKWDNKNKEEKPLIFKVLPGNSKQTDSVVRWRVEKDGICDSSVWTDKSLFKSWSKYSETLNKDKTLCYVTGQVLPRATSHPKYIRSSGDGAKLISANDNKNFTFRGRFNKAEEACSVGYEVTQKAHNALKWLISRQGYRYDTQVILAWATSGEEVPKITDDSYALCAIDELENEEDSIDGTAYTAQQFAHKLNKRIAGYGTKLGDTTDIVVMGLDSANPGRMLITFYRELTGSDFLKRLQDWHSTCYWVHNYKTIENPNDKAKKKNKVKFFGAPAPRDIAQAAYGTNINENLLKSTIERLLPCIIDGRAVPRDIVESAIRRASNRVSMEYWEWEKTLTIACALYNKFNVKEEYSVALEKDRESRDYLYGRLLALADSLERWALSDSGEKRLTNAERLMQRFADYPYTTWRTLELSLSPYKAKLGGRAVKFEKIQQEIMDKFKIEDFISNKKLSGEFLLGYHCQLSALYNKED